MIIDMYILIQCLILILMFIAWKSHQPVMWALSCIFSAINTFTSYNIEYIVAIHSAGVLTGNILSFAFPILSYINIALFMIAIVFFFWDIFNPKEINNTMPNTSIPGGSEFKWD